MQQLSTNPTEANTSKSSWEKTFTALRIVVSIDDNFHARFPNSFVDCPLVPMRVGDKLWTSQNKVSLRLWQTHLNFTVFFASSACGLVLSI